MLAIDRVCSTSETVLLAAHRSFLAHSLDGYLFEFEEKAVAPLMRPNYRGEVSILGIAKADKKLSSASVVAETNGYDHTPAALNTGWGMGKVVLWL